MAVDWDDPCARYAALRDAYFAATTGVGEVMIRRKGPHGEEEVRYHPADINRLFTEMNSAQAECAVKTSGVNPRRRSAIRLGARRRFTPPGYY